MGKKIKFKLFRKIIFLLASLLFASSILMNACLFEDLGLPETMENQNGPNVEEDIIIETAIDEEELFLEMKAKQMDMLLPWLNQNYAIELTLQVLLNSCLVD